MTDPTRMCGINGCEKPARTRGWCSGHYERWRTGRDVNSPLRLRIDGTPEERFWPRVSLVESGCWLWNGGTSNGYGCLGLGEGSTPAHRFAWQLLVGPLGDDVLLDHICRVTRCVNPAHLRVVDRKQNAENHGGGPRRDGTSGYRGVARSRNGKWRAYANHSGRYYSAGEFGTPEAADVAARELRKRLFTHNDSDRQPRDGDAA